MNTATIALILSVINLGWTIWTWRKGWQSRLKLTVDVVEDSENDGWIVRFTCLNESNHKVYISDATILPPRGSDPKIAMIPLDKLPEDRGLEPRQKVSFYYPGEKLAETHDFDNLRFEIKTHDTMAETRTQRLVHKALSVAIPAKRGDEFVANDEQPPALLAAKKLEWNLRYLERKGIVELRKADNGDILGARLVRPEASATERYISNLVYESSVHDAKPQARTERALYHAHLVVVLAKSGDEFVAADELPALLENRELEWNLQHLEHKGIVELRKDDDGNILAVRLTRRGRLISRVRRRNA